MIKLEPVMWEWRDGARTVVIEREPLREHVYHWDVYDDIQVVAMGESDSYAEAERLVLLAANGAWA